MPVGERVDRRVTWNHFFLGLAPLVFGSGRLFTRNLYLVAPPPGEPFFARPEACKVASARPASIRRRAQTQHEYGPLGWMIILLAPGCQFLPIAARAAGEFPGAGGPHTGSPASFATPATQRVNPEEGEDPFAKMFRTGNARIPSAALWTGKLH